MLAALLGVMMSVVMHPSRAAPSTPAGAVLQVEGSKPQDASHRFDLPIGVL